MRLPVAVVIVLAGICGCAPRAERAQPLDGDIVIEVKRARGVPPGRVFLKPVPGGFLGDAAGVPVLRSRIGAERVEFEVDALIDRLEGRAAMLRSDRFNPGELANPRRLRIARLGTFFAPLAEAGNCSNFRTSLVADAAKRGMLVYVDRAGSIRGSRYASPWIFEYELEFPSAGIYLVGSTTQGPVVTQRVLGSAGDVIAKVRRAPCG